MHPSPSARYAVIFIFFVLRPLELVSAAATNSLLGDFANERLFSKLVNRLQGELVVQDKAYIREGVFPPLQWEATKGWHKVSPSTTSHGNGMAWVFRRKYATRRSVVGLAGSWHVTFQVVF